MGGFHLSFMDLQIPQKVSHIWGRTWGFGENTVVKGSAFPALRDTSFSQGTM